MNLKFNYLLAALMLLVAFSCDPVEIPDPEEHDPNPPKIEEIASGLAGPVGLETDFRGFIWFTEAGTGNDDGTISILFPNGTTKTIVEGFPSRLRPDFVPEGNAHIVIRDGHLWLLNGVSGLLYRLDIRNLDLNAPPLSPADLQSEDIRTFILNFNFANDTDDSNIYNLVFDKDGNLYIVDSGANAVIKRDKQGNLSVFAEFAPIPNPLPFGGPTVEAVTTSIAFDGKNFFVGAFLGFPFPPGEGRIFTLDKQGNIVDTETGYFGLIDLQLDLFKKKLFALEYATFGEFGFEPNTGRLVRSTGSGPAVLADSLNFPTGLEVLLPSRFIISDIVGGRIIKVAP